jgi:hypothetical protein
VIPNIGDWGWLIGASLGAIGYLALMRLAPGLQPSRGVLSG